MLYQDGTIAVQAAADDAGGVSARALRLAHANINPATGLATDYLNHFNEAIMLLEMIASCPDCLDDFHRWEPMSYREHFLTSRMKGRDLAIAAYDDADPAARADLDTLANTMTTVIQATCEIMSESLPPQVAGRLAERAAAWLKLLVARAGAVINGEVDVDLPETRQTTVDGLMRRSA